MIQRVQSLFLLGIITCMVILLFVPLWEKVSNAATGEKVLLNTYSLSHYSAAEGDKVSSITENQNTIYLAVLAVVIAGIAGYELFSYKNRLFQRKLGAFNSLLMTALLGIVLYLLSNGSKLAKFEGKENFKLGFFVTIIAVILNILANRFILRDERLVKSADRMRD